MNTKKLLIIVMVTGIITGLILIKLFDNLEISKQQLEKRDCFIKIPQTIHIAALKAYTHSVIDSDYVEVQLPRNLCIAQYPSETQGYYIVQFKDQDINGNQIIDLGGKILSYVPENAFIVKMNENTKDKVQDLENVRWVGIYQPAYKISMGLSNRTGNVTLRVIIFDNENVSEVVDKIKSFGGTTSVTPDPNLLIVLIDASKIPDIANINGVWFIERNYGERQLSKARNSDR